MILSVVVVVVIVVVVVAVVVVVLSQCCIYIHILYICNIVSVAILAQVINIWLRVFDHIFLL